MKALRKRWSAGNSTLCRCFRPELGKVSRVLLILLITICAILVPTPARASVPGLQVNPLEYRDALTAGRVKTGYVEVANPGDALVVIESSVRGFRQTGTEGALEFYNDPQLSAGIKVDLTGFELGPREAIRVGFNVDPAKLPSGGVYAVIFFRTVPPPQSAGSSYVAESANIGTLLELTNGPAGPRLGEIATAHIPFWQFGSSLTGQLNYRNTDRSAHPVGFRPNLTLRVLPWGKIPKLDTGLVLPGATRTFQIRRHGSYFGLLPLTITDTDTRRSTSRWVFACTGWYQWLLLVLVSLLILMVFIRPRRIIHRFHRLAASLRRWLKHRRKPIVKRPMDGLSRKSKN